MDVAAASEVCKLLLQLDVDGVNNTVLNGLVALTQTLLVVGGMGGVEAAKGEGEAGSTSSNNSIGGRASRARAGVRAILLGEYLTYCTPWFQINLKLWVPVSIEDS